MDKRVKLSVGEGLVLDTTAVAVDVAVEMIAAAARALSVVPSPRD